MAAHQKGNTAGDSKSQEEAMNVIRKMTKGNNKPEEECWLQIKKGLWITDEICDAVQETKARHKKATICCSCDGKIGRLLKILLSEGSACSCLTLDQITLLCGDQERNQGLVTWQALGSALASSNLKHLTITNTSLPPQGMAALAAGLGVSSTRLQTLTLADTQWEEADDKALASALSHNRHLQTIRWQRCGLEDARLARLVQSLRDHPSLLELSLSGNKFAHETSVALSELLQCSDLQSLCLDNHAYRHRRNRDKLNIEMLALALGHNTKLRSLDLSDNLLDDTDLDLLARAMSHHSYLQTIILAYNKISHEGFSRFVHHWLPRIHHLQTLDLRGNWMEDIIIGPAKRRNSSHHEAQLLRNHAIKAMVELKDVSLIKAVALPERISPGLWHLLLNRLQKILHQQNEATTGLAGTTTIEDLLYLTIRGPMVSSLNL
ncbi:Leucine-rich repeat protein [Seminavis robusta]|uniref:Leucine-rich repeat protein n=1 Tax=Seminavis robusta TaxID=568900 RepID=A0A9N8HCM9_9STRA|nr:Leucine-rich repeat protein [Seminavis robusta]|eukprot:Sro419_g138980.1 Leucine-rich repeat protein (436) ;mRNA; r:2373-3680